MPHIANTPESLLPRTDSLNPSTTCRGTTNSGKPCRRPLTTSPDSPPPAKLAKSDPSVLFCWQHKDQAASVLQEATAAAAAPNGTNPSAQANPRTSIDTLMERLGVMDLNGGDGSKPHRRRTQKQKKKKKTRRTICCCFEVIEEEDLPVPARPVQSPPSQPAPQPQMTQVSTPPVDRARQKDPIMKWIPPTLSDQTTTVLASELEKPISDADEPGYIYMFWMTPTDGTNNNGNEMTRSGSGGPPTRAPTRELASSLLAPETGSSRHQNPRRISDALQTAREMNSLTTNPTETSPGTLRLKIGRANNVQRRLNEWSRQCSHELTLIRYYPYTPSTPSPSPSPSPARHGAAGRHASPGGLQAGRKVPHVHRVERLIHLELADVKARDLGKCPDCGKEHREWFEVPADKASLKRVDDCIRRWVEWAETH
ncbi:uncharacterized protein KD926_007860 [Aspergillus affinis]|uniref:uncharacterized protein n=1 Tax=Aspergillus affinis TaxID=1070780 RepID=UPI0022FF3902|nr:DUF1766-domain-containing protein [Aspergillus affinis]KAI9040644.1 DUF1766-domain-containing protein [Aspergillus affinis]